MRRSASAEAIWQGPMSAFRAPDRLLQLLYLQPFSLGVGRAWPSGLTISCTALTRLRTPLRSLIVSSCGADLRRQSMCFAPCTHRLLNSCGRCRQACCQLAYWMDRHGRVRLRQIRLWILISWLGKYWLSVQSNWVPGFFEWKISVHRGGIVFTAHSTYSCSYSNWADRCPTRVESEIGCSRCCCLPPPSGFVRRR